MNQTTDNPFSLRDQVVFTHHDWTVGEIEYRGEVTAILSPARCRVLVHGDAHLVVSVPVEDMRLAAEPAANPVQRRAA